MLSLPSRPVIRVIVCTTVSLIVWAAGWILFNRLQLWTQIANTDYQNALLIGLGLVWLIGFMFKARSATPPPSPQTSSALAASSMTDDIMAEMPKMIQKLQETVEEMRSKVSDFHAFDKVAATSGETRLAGLDKRVNQIEQTINDVALVKKIEQDMKGEKAKEPPKAAVEKDKGAS